MACLASVDLAANQTRTRSGVGWRRRAALGRALEQPGHTDGVLRLIAGFGRARGFGAFTTIDAQGWRTTAVNCRRIRIARL